MRSYYRVRIMLNLDYNAGYSDLSSRKSELGINEFLKSGVILVL